MIQQSLKFDITGKEADLFLMGCIERGITPTQALSDLINSFIYRKKSPAKESPYSQDVSDYLLSDDKEYQRFDSVEALFADLDDD